MTQFTIQTILADEARNTLFISIREPRSGANLTAMMLHDSDGPACPETDRQVSQIAALRTFLRTAADAEWSY